MKVLFIGGTGNISKVCAELAMVRGHDVTLLNRGKNNAVPGARQIVADMSDTAAVASALGTERWDVVADFIIFTPEQLEQRIGLFRGPHWPIHFHQHRERVSEARHALSRHGIHASRQSVLGLFAGQNRVRRPPVAPHSAKRIFPAPSSAPPGPMAKPSSRWPSAATANIISPAWIECGKENP